MRTKKAGVKEMRAVLLVLLLSLSASALRPTRKLVGLRAPPLPAGTEVAKPQWFQQKPDHFSESDTRTWQQRFFSNRTFWEPESGPVFLMLGGEGPANPAWLATDTDIMRNAARFGALVFLLEHRCVRFSLPDTSNFPSAGTMARVTQHRTPLSPIWPTSPVDRPCEMLSPSSSTSWTSFHSQIRMSGSRLAVRIQGHSLAGCGCTTQTLWLAPWQPVDQSRWVGLGLHVC